MRGASFAQDVRDPEREDKPVTVFYWWTAWAQGQRSMPTPRTCPPRWRCAGLIGMFPVPRVRMDGGDGGAQAGCMFSHLLRLFSPCELPPVCDRAAVAASAKTGSREGRELHEPARLDTRCRGRISTDRRRRMEIPVGLVAAEPDRNARSSFPWSSLHLFRRARSSAML